MIRNMPSSASPASSIGLLRGIAQTLWASVCYQVEEDGTYSVFSEESGTTPCKAL